MAKQKMTDEELEQEFMEALREIKERNLAAIRVVSKTVNAITCILIVLLGFAAFLIGGGCIIYALISILSMEYDAASIVMDAISLILGGALIAVATEAATYVMD